MPRSKGWLGQVHKNGRTGIPRISFPLLAALTPDKHKIELIDTRFNEPGYEDPPDLAAISAFTGEVNHAYKMADEFRRKGSKVVMGGIHVSMLPDEALKHADCVVIGEAETIWPKVLEDIEDGKLQPVYKAKEFNELSGLPLARRELLEKDRYFTISSIQATRGCPFDCSFCSVTIFNGRKIRLRPVEEVVREIKILPDKNSIVFLDDNIAANFDYAKKLFRAIEPLKIRWSSQVSFNCTKDKELLSLMNKSGCDFVLIGFESVIQESLNDSRKGRWSSVDKYAEGIQTLHKHHINIIGSFVVGLDHDTKDIFPKTFDFIMKHSIDGVIINILTPYPGTALYKEFKREGRIFDHDWDNYYNSNVVYYPKKMSPAELMDGYYWLMHEIYKPKNIVRRIIKKKNNFKSRLALNISYYGKTKRFPNVKWEEIGKVSQHLDKNLKN